MRHDEQKIDFIAFVRGGENGRRLALCLPRETNQEYDSEEFFHRPSMVSQEAFAPRIGRTKNGKVKMENGGKRLRSRMGRKVSTAERQHGDSGGEVGW